MHDAKALLDPAAEAALARRGYPLDVEQLGELVQRRAELIKERDALRSELNAARKVRPQGGDVDPVALREQARANKDRLQKLEEQARSCEDDLRQLLLTIPNLPSDDAPDGKQDDPGVEIRSWGEQPAFDFAPRDHVELGTGLGIIDLARAAKLSGSRFAVTRGAAARLERALVSFLLDMHTAEHGYVEHGLPHLVGPETMTGTGQLPKFAEDLFATGASGRDLLLIPTAEVPLVNLYREETLDESALPLALTAHTPCYRAEAGSYGRDTRGLIRLHQFDKVELVRICHPDQAAEQLELLVSHAEACLQRLGLHYRVVDLVAGDLGFAARRTYDIEVWLPGQGAYREISSCSDCGTFQGRRAGIKVSRRGGQKAFAATLNGSALPVGRTLVAILEQYQRSDGSVVVPPALVPYAGMTVIEPVTAMSAVGG